MSIITRCGSDPSDTMCPLRPHVENPIGPGSELGNKLVYFCTGIGNLVPHNDHAWDLYLLLYEILGTVQCSTISSNEMKYLENLIKNHNNLYMVLFNENLKPKFHLMLHCIHYISQLGPLKYLSCSKFESFHQLSKKHARVINSRFNIIYTLAMKLQLQLSYRFLSKRGLEMRMEFGQIFQKYDEAFNLSLPGNREVFIVSRLQVNGTTYKPESEIFLDINNNEDPCFGLIDCIVVNDLNKIHLIYKKCNILGLNNHIKCYQVCMPHEKEKKILYQLDFNTILMLNQRLFIHPATKIL